MTDLYLVVPCYNEQEVLPDTNSKLVKKLRQMIAGGKISSQSRILYVDDGSKDNTWSLISQYHEACELVSGLKLAHNRGHQNALLAGLMAAKERCGCAISLDADLQDDIEVFDDFLKNFEEGCDVVYGVRKKRDTDTFFKRTTARGFYKLMEAMDVDIVFDHADYRLMSRRALEALSEYKEVNLFLRGIVPLIGYRSDYVYYERKERLAGESKYPLKKMLSFAVDGITSFSVKPLRVITVVGMFFLLGSILAAIITLLCGVFGAASIYCLIGFIGGIQLLCTGILGTYIGKIYAEVKCRPRYRVEEIREDR